jgi:hypothetical protein
MICDRCRRAADGLRKTHPKNCGCSCQHKPRGSWKGTKS